MPIKDVTVNGEVVRIAAPAEQELVPYMVGLALKEHYGKRYQTMHFDATVSADGKSYKAIGNGQRVKITLVV